jgi:hypothetical protein
LANNNATEIGNNIANIFERRKAAIYGLSQQYSALALQYFRRHQEGNEYWNNQTSDAMNTMFTRTFKEGDSVGWLMAHHMAYGVYLELSNDGRHEAIRLVITIYANKFLKALDNLYGGSVGGINAD